MTDFVKRSSQDLELTERFLLMFQCLCVFYCVSTVFPQRPAEYHTAGKLSFTIRPSEEADRGLKQRKYPERYQPVPRHKLVATAGAYFTYFSLTFVRAVQHCIDMTTIGYQFSYKRKKMLPSLVNLQLIGYASDDPFRILILHTLQPPSS